MLKPDWQRMNRYYTNRALTYSTCKGNLCPQSLSPLSDSFTNPTTACSWERERHAIPLVKKFWWNRPTAGSFFSCLFSFKERKGERRRVNERWAKVHGDLMVGSSMFLSRGPNIWLTACYPQSHAVSTSKRGVPLFIPTVPFHSLNRWRCLLERLGLL